MSEGRAPTTKGLSPETLGAIHTVVDTVVADLLDREYSRDHVEAAMSRGEYVVLYSVVHERLAELGPVKEETLRSESKRLAREWQRDIRGSTSMSARRASDPVEYEVECWLEADGPERPSLRRKTVPGDQTNATFEDLPPGRWVARVRGVNSAGAGPWTEEVSVVVDRREQ